VSPLEIAAAFGIVCGALIGFLTLLEKLTGFGSRWLANGIEAGTRTLREDVNDLKSDFLEHRTYTKYHLGPNGDSPKLHERVEGIEESISAVVTEQSTVRTELANHESHPPDGVQSRA